MKKIVMILLAVLMLTASLCGCGGGKTEAKTVDLDAIAAKLAQSGVFSVDLTQREDATAVRLYGYNEADVKKCVLYLNGSNTAEEIFLVEAADAKAAGTLKGLCEARVSNQKSVFQNYSPEDIARLDDAVLVTTGNYVLLVISNNSAEARNIVEGFTK